MLDYNIMIQDGYEEHKRGYDSIRGVEERGGAMTK
jgi:hypothetical protein